VGIINSERTVFNAVKFVGQCPTYNLFKPRSAASRVGIAHRDALIEFMLPAVRPPTLGPL